MSIKKLTYYLEDVDVTLRSNHLPLKKFLAKNTLNCKGNIGLLKFYLSESLLNTLKELKHFGRHHEQIDSYRSANTTRT